MISQDVLLFDGEIKENLPLGKPRASDEEIILALQKAGIWEHISKLSEGIDTIIGSKGIGLSGGQKQRLAIARIYLKNPPIIIFDEATSSLDSETETQIHKAWKEMLKGRTSIIIAHRQSSVMLCDRVALMENGKIIELGTPKDLEKTSHAFKELFALKELFCCFLSNGGFAPFSVIVIPLTFWLDHIIAKREKVVLDEQRENDQKMSSWLHASVQGWREIKALNLQKHEERQFARYIHKYAIFFGTWINYWVARVLVIPKIKEEFLMQFSLYFFGGLLIINGRFEIGSLLVFMQYYGILSGAIKTVSSTDAESLTNMPQSDRMIDELSHIVKIHNKKQVLRDCNTIELRNVSFSYQNTDVNVINNLNLTISDGERIAITGKSGAGKTTVLKLIMGMLCPTSGAVLFSNVNIKDLSLELMHQRIGFVMQENTLFNTSIRENLYYGKNNADDSELETVCRKAFIYDFIKSLPDGFDTVIGERGIKLSGGQKQSIILARLFLRDVKVFIFDEATSALDQYSENIIKDAIMSIGQDKILIVVAHRQSSLSLCDRVITL
ncbi:atp-binding cassette sub-family b [Holotrichia oblita]|nr:atp-binding cassette sub-family b [Holotrichia oblita]